jgi:hypothetical protein
MASMHLLKNGFYKPIWVLMPWVWNQKFMEICWRKKKLNVTFNSERLQLEKNIDLSGGFGWRVFQIISGVIPPKDLCVLPYRWTNECGDYKGRSIFMIFWRIWPLFSSNHIKLETGSFTGWCWWGFRDWFKLEQTVSQKQTLSEKSYFLSSEFEIGYLWRFGSSARSFYVIILGWKHHEEIVDNVQLITFSPERTITDHILAKFGLLWRFETNAEPSIHVACNMQCDEFFLRKF